MRRTINPRTARGLPPLLTLLLSVAGSANAQPIGGCTQVVRVTIAPELAGPPITKAVRGWLSTDTTLNLFVGSDELVAVPDNKRCPRSAALLSWIHRNKSGGVLVLARANQRGSGFAKRNMRLPLPLDELNAERVAQALHSLIAAHDAGQTPLFWDEQVTAELKDSSVPLAVPVETSSAPLASEPVQPPEAPTRGPESTEAADAQNASPPSTATPSTAPGSLQFRLAGGYSLRARGDEPLAHGPLLRAAVFLHDSWGLSLEVQRAFPSAAEDDLVRLEIEGTAGKFGAVFSPSALPISVAAGAAIEWPTVGALVRDAAFTPTEESPAARTSIFTELSYDVRVGRWLLTPHASFRYQLKATTYSTEFDGERTERWRAWRFQPEFGLRLGFILGPDAG